MHHKSQKCEFCSKVFSSVSAKNSHMEEIHIRKKNITCDICCVEFTTNGSLKKHIHDVHGDTMKYVCDVCGNNMEVFAIF